MRTRPLSWPTSQSPNLTGPDYQVEETFFQLNKEELSLRATMDLVGPSRQALHVQSSSDDSRLLTTPHRAQRGGGRLQGPKLE